MINTIKEHKFLFTVIFVCVVLVVLNVSFLISRENECSVKGNVSTSGEKIYHIRGQKYYNNVIINESKGEQIFCTEGEAKEKGFRKSLI